MGESLVWAVTVLALLSMVACIDDKCAACNAVAEELELGLSNIDSTRREWMKVNDWDNLTTNKQAARAYSKDISSYCGRLLEETEDELAELIKKGSVRKGNVSKVLCQDLSKHCSQTSGSHEAENEDDGSDNDDDGSDGEL
ncbi:hypothetical protein L1049_025450 [Liquidambar formosana]|uniref:DUF3456 domain-containing protein n=1 Tax=Liquidambar formosana TaxID=63359 RepID=A0AAP0R4L8_LIQFO